MTYERPNSARLDASAPSELAQWACEEITRVLYAGPPGPAPGHRPWIRPSQSMEHLITLLDDAMYALDDSRLYCSYQDQADNALLIAARAIMIADRALMLGEAQKLKEEGIVG